MIERSTRRKVLSTGLTAFVGCLSGCYWGNRRSIYMADMQKPVQRDSEVVLKFEVGAGASGLADSEAQFQDVAVIGYTSDKRIICESFVGTIGLDQKPEVTLRCSETPQYLTLTIGEAGCQYDTSISVYRVNPPDSDVSYTKVGQKECSDPDMIVPD